MDTKETKVRETDPDLCGCGWILLLQVGRKCVNDVLHDYHGLDGKLIDNLSPFGGGD